MEENVEERSLVDEINTNWDAIPIKYDNFMEMCGPDDDQQDLLKKVPLKLIINFLKFRLIFLQKRLENSFKYALTFKQAPLPSKGSPKSPLSTQNIAQNHIEAVTRDVRNKRELIRLLDEAIAAFESVINRASHEQPSYKQNLLKLVKKDFMKQQSYFVTAVQKYFPNNERDAHLLLNVRLVFICKSKFY